MPEKFVIEGQHKLEGEVEIQGSKNAAGALIAATLLTQEECVLKNAPKTADILNLLAILEEMGVEIAWQKDKKLKLKAGRNTVPEKINFEKFSKSRVSVLLIGALLARFGEFKISRPGGDRIGLRPITTHLEALKELGCDIKEEGDFYYFKSVGLKGKEIILPEFSVTATETLLLAAALAKGKTVLKTAAQEPQVENLIQMLKKMGSYIEGANTHTLSIEGVKILKKAEADVIPDLVEAGTFMVMGAVTQGRILLKNVLSGHLDLFLLKLAEIGVEFRKNSDSIEVFGAKNLKPVKLQALPHPGFPTDLLPLAVPLLTQAQGKSLIHDPLYENRLNYTQELRKMGADIEIVDPHRAFVFGKTGLKGVSIESWDIRAGASLIVAGLMAKGKTTIKNIEQVDRGYERIEERLQKLGARIERVST